MGLNFSASLAQLLGDNGIRVDSVVLLASDEAGYIFGAREAVTGADAPFCEKRTTLGERRMAGLPISTGG